MPSARNFLIRDWRIVSVGYFQLGIKVSELPNAQLRIHRQCNRMIHFSLHLAS
jgi:hypothetical protein